MFRKGVRSIWIVIICVLAFRVLAVSIFMRAGIIILAVIALLVGIFALARYGSRKTANTRAEKKKAEPRQAETKKSETVNREEKCESSSEVKFENATPQDHIKAATTALTGICCMDIRYAGMDVLKTAKNILKEKEEGNACHEYAQFEKYYLPTFRKTVEDYSRMERKGVTGLKHREDVLAYLKSCNEAFTRIYNSMFEDDIIDMEVQMKAMNLTFKREGLL